MALDNSSEAFDKYLAAAVGEVEKALEGGGVAILAPPGSARDRVVVELVRRGIVAEDDVLLYEELHKRVGVGRPLRRAEGQFYVGEEPLLHYLKRGTTLGYALRQRKVVIAPRDTWEALLIRGALLEALGEEKTWTIGEVKKMVKVLFLPAHYQGKELAEVDYQHTLRGVVKEARGYSPSLQRLAAVEPKLAKEALEVFRALDPGRYFGEGLYSIVVGMGISASLAALATPVAGPLALALMALSSEDWANILAEAEKEGLKELLATLIKRRRGDLRQLFASALKALRYVDDERVEARVDEIAAKWGLTREGFKALLQLLAGKIVTREELERLKTLGDEDFRKAVEELVEKKWEEVKKELEERIAALEKEVEELRKKLQEKEISDLFPYPIYKVYISAEKWPYVEEVDEEARLIGGLLGERPPVFNSLIDVVAEALANAAKRGGGVVLVKGGKGVGKSTAAAVAVYHLLRGAVRVGERVYKTVAVEVRGDIERGVKVEGEVDRGIQNSVAKANKAGYLPVLYFDPSKLPAYPVGAGEEYVPEASIDMVKRVVARLFDVVKPEMWHAVALVVLSNDQYKVVEGEISRRVKSGAGRWLWVIDADEVLKEEKADFVKDLVEKYSGCSGDVIKRVADAIASQFADGYAVAAVLTADWLKSRGCYGGEVERAVKEAEGNIHRFILDYLWYGLFRGDNVTAERYAPLLLAVGFFGPHPPKLAEAIVRAFGKEPEDAVIRWFFQPLHGTLYEAVRKVAHGAVYKQFKVGNDELCQGSGGEPCRLVEICTKALVRVPQRGYGKVEEVAEEYAMFVAKALEASEPDGVRQIDFLINDFLRAYNGIVENGRWRIRYEIEVPWGIEAIEHVVDELDIMAVLYELAVLPGWRPRFKPLEDWFFVGGKKTKVFGLYLYPLLKERGEELVKRVVAIVNEVERRGFYAPVDFRRAVGIVAAGKWDSATDEELEKAVRLAAVILRRFATAMPIVLKNIKFLLSETWRRVINGETQGDGGRRQRLADRLTVVAYNAARGRPSHLPRIFVPEKEESDLETVAERFNVLYNAASDAGKLRLLDMLLYALDWGIRGVNVAAVLLGIPQLGRHKAFEEVTRRIEEFVTHLNGVEKAYVAARLYPRLANHYASFGEFDKAVKHIEESRRALEEELWKTYKEDKVSTEEMLRSYLTLKQIKPDLGRVLSELSQRVYHNAALVYMAVGNLDEAMRYAEKACNLTGKLSVVACGLPPRLKAVKDGAPPVEEFEKLWQSASQAILRLGAKPVATTLGRYVAALASAGRFSDVEKVLERWGWALGLSSITSALTYGVLSLYDLRYLEKAVGYLPEGARANLPRLADALHDAVEAGVFSKEPKIAMSAEETLKVVYGSDVVEALLKLAPSSKLFLSALVGLAYCKRGGEWGLKLAKEAARAGSRAKGIAGRLFGELYMALEGAKVGNCLTDEVHRAVYKLYYRHV